MQRAQLILLFALGYALCASQNVRAQASSNKDKTHSQSADTNKPYKCLTGKEAFPNSPYFVNGVIGISIPTKGIISKPAPILSEKEKEISGTVIVRIKIDEQGRVIEARAISGPLALLTPSEKAACQAQFVPVLLQGQPVKSTFGINYKFVGSKGVGDAHICLIGGDLKAPVEAAVINSQAISKPEPVVPPEAKEASGNVVVIVNVDERGEVTAAHAVSGPKLLFEETEKAACQALFKPAELSGHPIKFQGALIYKFSPNGDVK